MGIKDDFEGKWRDFMQSAKLFQYIFAIFSHYTLNFPIQIVPNPPNFPAKSQFSAFPSPPGPNLPSSNT